MEIKFYLIRHHGKPVYVGSTKETLQNRLESHFQAVLQRRTCKIYIAILNDPDGWTIDLLETHNLSSTKQKRAIATRIIETRLKKKWNTTLNETNGLCK